MVIPSSLAWLPGRLVPAALGSLSEQPELLHGTRLERLGRHVSTVLGIGQKKRGIYRIESWWWMASWIYVSDIVFFLILHVYIVVDVYIIIPFLWIRKTRWMTRSLLSS